MDSPYYTNSQDDGNMSEEISFSRLDFSVDHLLLANKSHDLEKLWRYENWLINGTRETFWTPYHRFLMKLIPWQLHFALGIVVALIGIMGTISNGLVLFIFSKFRKLRTPANMFVINLAISDMSAALLHPLAAYSSFHGYWAFGQTACHMYALGVGFFGLNSIVTLAAVAFERYLVITSQPLSVKWKITRSRARKICVLIWLYCACLVIPPLFGWSSYAPEGLLTTCSWDYSTRTLSNRLYYIYLLVLGFVVPVSVIALCYWTILRVVTCHGREMTHLATPSQKTSFRKRRLETDLRTAHAIVTLVILYLITWTPYAVVSLIGQFGPPQALTPLATALPAFFAKGAVVFDPVVYGFSHPHFRMSLHQYFSSFSYRPTAGAADGVAVRNSNCAASSLCNASPKMSLRYPAQQGKPGGSTRLGRLRQRDSIQSSQRSFISSREVVRNTRDSWYSEPDLMRSGARVIPGAPMLTYAEYREKKRTFLQKVFFRSESVLTTAVDAVRVGGKVTRPSLRNSVGRSYSLRVPHQSRALRKIERKRRSVHCENCCECAQRSTGTNTITVSCGRNSRRCQHGAKNSGHVQVYLGPQHSISFTSEDPSY